MKNKYIPCLLCAAALALFTMVSFHNLKVYCDEILNSAGMSYDNFEEKLRNENEAVSQRKNEYREIKKQPEETGKSKAITKDLKLHALSALLLDASNNRVLYEENGYDEMPMASTTKIMTCIVTLENSKLDDVVTISPYAARMPDVQLNVRAGEQYYLGDLLYSLMLESHNDVAVAIAEHVGGSVEGFAAMMNDKAKELGCEHTHFVTPNGLDAVGHYTTARDLAIIASYAIKNEKFLEVTNTSSHNFKEIKKGRSFTVTNKNRFLYMMNGAIGIKTGFTSDAGYCFVGAVRKMDKTLISVVLGCGWPPNKNLKWSDTKELMSYGIDHYKERQIFEEVDLKPVSVKKGQKKSAALKLAGNLTLLMRDDETVRVEYEVPEMLKAPVTADSIVGKAKYYINDVYYTELPIYAAEGVDKINLKYCFKKILDLWRLQY